MPITTSLSANISTVLAHLQGQWLHHPLGQPVPLPNHSLWEESPPNIQPLLQCNLRPSPPTLSVLPDRRGQPKNQILHASHTKTLWQFGYPWLTWINKVEQHYKEQWTWTKSQKPSITQHMKSLSYYGHLQPECTYFNCNEICFSQLAERYMWTPTISLQ